MTCDEFNPFIDAFIDQELDEQDAAEMEAHLATCESCREHASAQMRFKELLKESLGNEKAPAALRGMIFDELAELSVEGETPAEVVVLAEANPRRGTRWAWAALPIAAAFALMLVLPNLAVAPASSNDLPVVSETVEWHRGNYPLEVTGPESKDVSQWFGTMVDFPVRPPQFKDDSVQLLGGRIANIRDRRAAYLRYEVDGTRMSVIIFDGEGLKVPGDNIQRMHEHDVAIVNQHGYNVAVLQDSGVTYAITSELSDTRFVEILDASLRR